MLVASAALVAILGATIAFASPAYAAKKKPKHPKVTVQAVQTPTITGMWAWGNSVDPSDDPRGLGEAGMAPDAMAAFAKAQGLTSVYLSAPWASDQGPIAAWAKKAVDAFHADGIQVSALGGDPTWMSQPQLAVQWATAAHNAAGFDAIQFDLEPWVADPNLNYTTMTKQYVTVLTQVKAATGLPMGADLPWWLSTKAYGKSTAFATIAAKADSVAIVTFVDHADGSDGIIALATPSVKAAVAAGTPFTIGVETDLPAVAGGSQYTFFDNGAAALQASASQVRTAFGAKSGYSGVTVEHLLAWKSLIGAGAVN